MNGLIDFLNFLAYVRGFPEDDKPHEIVKSLEQFGEIEYCQKRFADLKPYVYVTFKIVDDCRKLVEAESVSHNGSVLERRWKEDFVNERKAKYKEQQDLKAQQQLKERQAQRAKIEAFKEQTKFPAGTIMAFWGVKRDQVLTREHIMETIRDIMGHDRLKVFISYDCMDHAGYVRFSDEQGAYRFTRRLRNSMMRINDVKVQCRVLSGEFEEEYLSVTAEELYYHQNKPKRGKFTKVFMDNLPPAKRIKESK